MPRITCPTCASLLDITDDMVGTQVECGGCQARFVAKIDKPSRRDEDDEDRPSRRRRKRVEDEDEDPRRSRRRSRDDDDDDDEDDDEPRRRRRSSQGGGTATTSMTLGIISIPLAFCCGIFGGILAVIGLILGFSAMSGPNRGQALTGVITSAIGLIMCVGMVVLGMAFNLAALNNQAPFAPPAPPVQNKPFMPPAPKPPMQFK